MRRLAALAASLSACALSPACQEEGAFAPTAETCYPRPDDTDPERGEDDVGALPARERLHVRASLPRAPACDGLVRGSASGAAPRLFVRFAQETELARRGGDCALFLELRLQSAGGEHAALLDRAAQMTVCTRSMSHRDAISLEDRSIRLEGLAIGDAGEELEWLAAAGPVPWEREVERIECGGPAAEVEGFPGKLAAHLRIPLADWRRLQMSRRPVLDLPLELTR